MLQEHGVGFPHCTSLSVFLDDVLAYVKCNASQAVESLISVVVDFAWTEVSSAGLPALHIHSSPNLCVQVMLYLLCGKVGEPQKAETSITHVY